MRFLTWNTAWASPRARRGQLLLEQVRAQQPDVAVFTEVTEPWLDALGGYTALAASDYGYEAPAHRRKVALWSRTPIGHIECSGSPALPGGRYVQGSVEQITVMGVCIPWRDAHVRTGQRNRAAWQDHATYIEALGEVAALHHAPLIVAGDFNQRHPRARQPQHLHDALTARFEHLVWHTSGLLPPLQEAAIDHVLTSPDLATSDLVSLSRQVQGVTLSDHFGIVCRIDNETRA